MGEIEGDSPSEPLKGGSTEVPRLSLVACKTNILEFTEPHHLDPDSQSALGVIGLD